MTIRNLTPKVGGSLQEYRAVVGDEAVDEILRLAEPLRGARILHLSVLSFGTLTSELLSTLVPLMGGAGLYAEWQAIQGTAEQHAAITNMYEALGGNFTSWTPKERERWQQYNDLHAGLLDKDYDFVVVHDPQPAGVLTSRIVRYGKRPPGRWIWHCHLDLAAAQPEVWDLLRPHLEAYDAVVYSSEEYVRSDLKTGHSAVIPPAIDPLSPRNVPLSDEVVGEVLTRHGLDRSRPLIVQVARLDRFSDPLGALEIYRLAKARMPELQLLLVAMMRENDLSAQIRYEQAARAMAYDTSARLLSSLNNLGYTEINAFQRAGRVALQTGVRKGHDLSILEAMWKGRPVVADRRGVGLSIEGVVSLLGSTPEECADNILQVLSHPARASSIGSAAHSYVRRRFLITRYLCDYLRLFQGLL